MLTDQDFLKARYEGIGCRNISFTEFGQDGEVFRIKCTRDVRSNPPAFARKIISEWNTLDETIEWVRQGDDSARAAYRAATKGVPGSIEGQFVLRSKGGGCEEDIAMTASVGIPMIGKKIAALVESESAEALAKEYDFTRDRLGER